MDAGKDTVKPTTDTATYGPWLPTNAKMFATFVALTLSTQVKFIKAL
jgi:hypothetical protein